mgnify:FL=1
MKQEEILILIPKVEKYIEYMINIIIKLPRTEKFNIGNEYKLSMYGILKNAIYINKVGNNKEIENILGYLNKIDAELVLERIYLRIMLKNRWIDEKKFKISMELIYEIGRIVGGLIKYYAKNNKKWIW